jgi:hypothetical protein
VVEFVNTKAERLQAIKLYRDRLNAPMVALRSASSEAV